MPDTKTFSLLDHPECWPEEMSAEGNVLEFADHVLSFTFGSGLCGLAGERAAHAIIREHMIRTIARDSVRTGIRALRLWNAIAGENDKYLYHMFTRAKEASK